MIRAATGLNKHPMAGRPSKYTEALAQKILNEIARGKSLSRICQRPGMPDISTIYHWKKIIDGFSERLKDADELKADTLWDEAVDIADTPQIGETITEKPVLDDDGRPMRDRKGRPVLQIERKLSDMTEHRRLRIATRHKNASRLNRKKYGERPEEQKGQQGPIVIYPLEYIDAVNRALGYTGQLIPLGRGSGPSSDAIEGEVVSTEQDQNLDVLPD